IVLDDRRVSHDGIGESSSFERAVAASASLCDLYLRSGYSWRLTTAAEPGFGASKGADHFHRCLDQLSTVEAQSAAEELLLMRLAEIEAQGSVEAALVLVGGTLSPEVAVALSRCRRSFRQVTAVSFPSHRFGSGATKARWEGERHTMEVLRLLGRSGVRTVVLGPDESLAMAWVTSAQGRREGEQWGRKPELV
ncbi:MAG: hypothetical protein M3124_00720, partial [Actinomycetota bacterium]|nr:hypothetical protein [Actinomycetota bacterium]